MQQSENATKRNKEESRTDDLWQNAIFGGIFHNQKKVAEGKMIRGKWRRESRKWLLDGESGKDVDNTIHSFGRRRSARGEKRRAGWGRGGENCAVAADQQQLDLEQS
ncbi:hypothetical protein niasHT_004447 [Heterodera trifolii]|uniref:Uncharacterized protein n=1 Tax=Heterodera trifolii TaxID=157864 RepID=A0ABD2LT19_9BILA